MILPLIELAAYEVHVPIIHHPRIVLLRIMRSCVFMKMLWRRRVETVCEVLEGVKLAVPEVPVPLLVELVEALQTAPIVCAPRVLTSERSKVRA